MSLPVVGSDYCTCELVAATNASATTILVSTPTNNFPTLGAGEYWYLTIVDAASYEIDANPPVQREIVKVTAVASVSTGYSLTCVRGITTTAQIWASGSIAEIRPCEQWFEDLKSTEGSTWAITDGITTVTDVTSLFVNATGDATVEITDLGSNAAALTVGATGGGGGTSTLQSEEFTTGGTFTPDSGVTAVWINMVGGGGAGGGSNTAAGSGAGGGASGECVEGFLVAVSGAVTVTVGAGGVASAGAAGGVGGNTSFGIYVAKGGNGGTIGNASGTNGVGGAGGGANGGTGGARGNPGSVGAIGTASSPTGFGGGGGGGGSTSTIGAGGAGAASAGYAGGAGGAAGGAQAGGGGGASSQWGVGGAGGAGGSNGVAADSSHYGAGGGGGGGSASTTTGGDGAPGYCIVSWIGP